MASSTRSAAALLLLSAAALLSFLTTPVSTDNRLDARQFLAGGNSLEQGDNYKFTMLTNCNLVLYDNNRDIWSTRTEGKGDNCGLIMQGDGNLVIYNGRTLVWESKTTRQDGKYYLLLQQDRNVVIYDNDKKDIWATNTKVDHDDVVVIPHSNGTAAASGAAQNKVKEHPINEELPF